jgi:hypothetical protein
VCAGMLVNAVYSRSRVPRHLFASVKVCAAVLVNTGYKRSHVSRRLLASL